MQLTSTAFDDGGPIPTRQSCDGDDVSPPLAWDGVPEDTAAFVLMVHDPDARGFIHWLLVDIPAEARSLAEGEGDDVGTPGRNNFGGTGWGGPCPPSGEHRYVFTLYALSEPVGLSGTPDADSARAAMEGLVLDQAQLAGTYAR